MESARETKAPDAAPARADVAAAVPGGVPLLEAITVPQLMALQRTAGNRAVTGWLARAPADAPEATKTKPAGNAFPWGGTPPDMLKDYLDEHAESVAVNLMTGMLYVSLDTGIDIQIPLVSVRASVPDLVPIFPPADSLKAAERALNPELRKALEERQMTPCVFYRGAGNVVWPSVFSEQTLPRVMKVYPEALEAARKDMEATADAMKDILLWYIGARLPMRTRRAPNVGKAAPAAKAAFDATKVADDLVAATSSIKAPPARMFEAAKQLSAMGKLAASQKVEVMLQFFNRIGFAIGKAGVVDEGAHFVMYSEQGSHAFRFLKESGKVVYGKLDFKTLEWVWTAL